MDCISLTLVAWSAGWSVIRRASRVQETLELFLSLVSLASCVAATSSQLIRKWCQALSAPCQRFKATGEKEPTFVASRAWDYISTGVSLACWRVVTSQNVTHSVHRSQNINAFFKFGQEKKQSANFRRIILFPLRNRRQTDRQIIIKKNTTHKAKTPGVNVGRIWM